MTARTSDLERKIETISLPREGLEQILKAPAKNCKVRRGKLMLISGSAHNIPI